MGFSVSKPSAGLVIRANEVECLALEGGRVPSTARVPLEGEDPQHLTQAIQQAVTLCALKTDRLAVSIEHPGVLFRSFSLPLLPKAEWDSAVQFEARRYIPFKTDSLVWDYHAVASQAAKRIDVVFAAIPREVFRMLQESLAAAGVHPTVMELRSLSLARLAAPARAGAVNEAVCLVDVEQDAAHLAIVKNGAPHLTRDIPLVPKTVVSAPPPDETAAGQAPPAVLPAPAPAGGDAGQQAASGDPRAQRLLSELSVSMDFFMREYPSVSMSRVVLFGEQGLVDAWGQWLAGQLTCPVETGSGLLSQRIAGGLELSFASAAGLLARGTGPDAVQLDFLKRGLAKAPRAPRSPVFSNVPVAKLLSVLSVPQAAVCAALAVGCLLAFWAAGSLQVESARRHLQQLVAARPDVTAGLAEMSGDALAPIKEQASTQLTLLKAIMEQRVSMAAKLDALARALPEGVWLTGLSFEDSVDPATGLGRPRLLVQGACLLGEAGKELRAIQAFEDRMKRNATFLKGFSAAQLDQIAVEGASSQQYTYRTFQLNCQSERRL